MEERVNSVTWEAPEHHHIEKGNDWYFALAILIIGMVISAILLNNVLLALLIGIAGGALAMSAAKKPSIIPFAVTARGVRIGDAIYPYSTLEAYHIDETDHKGPQLLVRSKRFLMPLLVLPVPPDYLDEVEQILAERLENEELEEPFLMKVLELFGI